MQFVLRRVVFERLAKFWDGIVAQGLHLLPTAAAGAARRARGTQQQQLNSQGLVDWDHEQVC